MLSHRRFSGPVPSAARPSPHITGAIGRIRTFARLSPPNSLANCPLQPLEYYRILKNFRKKIKSPFYFTFNHNMLWLVLHIDTIYSGLDTKYSEIKSIPCVSTIYSTICSGEIAWDTIYSGIPSFSRINSPHWGWSWRWDSNPQPIDYKSIALSITLRQRINGVFNFGKNTITCQTITFIHLGSCM